MSQESSRLRKFSYAAAIGALALFCPIPAHADAGIPMLPFAYPTILIFLIPVIAIESIYLRVKLRTGWRNTIAATSKANVVTMVLGFPLAWVLSVGLELLLWVGAYYTGISRHFDPKPGSVGFFFTIVFSAPWLGPVEQRWAIPVAFATLLIPSFLVSAWVESRLLGRGGWLRSEKPCGRAVWEANILSYLFLLVAGSLGLWVALYTFHL